MKMYISVMSELLGLSPEKLAQPVESDMGLSDRPGWKNIARGHLLRVLGRMERRGSMVLDSVRAVDLGRVCSCSARSAVVCGVITAGSFEAVALGVSLNELMLKGDPILASQVLRNSIDWVQVFGVGATASGALIGIYESVIGAPRSS